MYHLLIATPNKVVFDGNVNSLVAPGTEGFMEILTHHAPLISTLRPGKLVVRDSDNKMWEWTVSGGFLEVLNNEVSLLADSI